MTKQFEVYKCNICGNLVEVISPGEGELVCCGEHMELQVEKMNEEFQDHHIPVVEHKNENETLIKISKVEHPMTEKHHIKFIEVFTKNGILRKYLDINQKPEFLVKLEEEIQKVRAYCNMHGLWKGENYVNKEDGSRIE